MSDEQCVGTISTVHRVSREVVWKIERFFHIRPHEGLFVAYSTAFTFRGQEWKLGLWPNYKPQYVLVYLMRKGPSVISPSQTWKFHLGLKRRDGTEQNVDTKEIRMVEEFKKWTCSVMSHQLTRSLLEKETDALSARGQLTVFARVSVEGLPAVREITTQTEVRDYGDVNIDKLFFDEDFESCESEESKIEPVPSVKVLSTLSKDLKDLYLSENESNVTIKVNNVAFRAHTSILRVRAPVIAAKLSHNPLEATSDVINLEYCDPKAFNIFLQFVYSGDINLTNENVVPICGIADKYRISDLKEICIRFMLFNLNVGTVCSALRTALTYGENDLQVKATEFLYENAEEIFPTSEWERFMVENSTWAQKLIIGSFKYAKLIAFR